MNLKDKIIYKLRDSVEAIRENRILRNMKNTKFANLVREDRKVFGVLLVIMFLGVIAAGSFTGHVILTEGGVNEIKNNLSVTQATLDTCQNHLLDCNYEKTGLSNQITSLNGQVGSLNEQIVSLNSNLGLCNSARDNYNLLLQNCTNEKNRVASELDFCEEDRSLIVDQLDECKYDLDNYKHDLEDHEKIEVNFAKKKCCIDNYEFYTITEDYDLLCCYKNEGIYFCGKGIETDRIDTNPLNC
ncbi:MAG: hypothetical protein DRP06_03540 [Candidatus Aenigmatarchaeota archaeon]|nr:MAG: hypothetical protein DRP06_03540 [Candidatus Aenigmarchaeota archaeon]